MTSYRDLLLTLLVTGHANKHSMDTQSEVIATSGNHEGRKQPDQQNSGRRGNGNSRRRDRRRLDKELDVAARHRRQLAAETYSYHPPKLEDIWICEFCEYERIFGEPPRALIRDYELKDRRVRQEIADRKRMLEKAKAKARKNKKSPKATAKANQPAGHTPEPLQAELNGEHGPAGTHLGGNSTQSEEDYEDDLDEDYVQAPPPPSGPRIADPERTDAPLPPWPGPGT